MSKRKLIILSFLTVLFGVLMIQNASFSQSKKKQIEALNFKIDSVNQVIAKERNTQKTTISSLEIQESKSKQKVDSLSKEINSIENHINAKQIDKQNYEFEISDLKKEIEKQRDSLLRLTKEEFKTQTNFKSVEIGTQTWMTENLNVSTFRNGDIILEAKTEEDWTKACNQGKPAWCYYDNDIVNGRIYGKLYNWYAVTDSRGLAPTGWHIPTDAEWITLENYLGDDSGKKMKNASGWNNWEESSTCKNCVNWNDEYRKKTACHVCRDTRLVIEKLHSLNGINSSGFSALPGGNHFYAGRFFLIGYVGIWWAANANVYGHRNRYIYKDKIRIDQSININRDSGLSVRCIKD